METLRKTGPGGTSGLHRLDNEHPHEPAASTTLNGEKLEAFPLRSGTRQGVLPHHVHSAELQVLSTAMGSRRK